jgi:hypothetical protein
MMAFRPVTEWPVMTKNNPGFDWLKLQSPLPHFI